MEFLINIIASQRKNVLLIGETGTAKTVTIRSYLSKQDSDKILTKVLNFSSATTCEILRRNIEGAVDKRIGTIWGPAGNRRMMVH